MNFSGEWRNLFPAGVRRDIVIDTDAANETDDQFAVAWALMNPDSFRIRGIYAAPYRHMQVAGEGEGMFNSYWELRRLAALFPELDLPVLMGASRFLTEGGAAANPASLHLVELSRSYSRENPLRVIAIAALTNIAVALALDPTLAERIEVYWLGGQDYRRSAHEFNLDGDPKASEMVVNSTALPVCLFPCAGVAETLLLNIGTARERVLPCGAPGRFLYNRLRRMVGNERPESASSIWDLAPFFALSRPEWVEMACCERRELRSGEWGAPLGEAKWWMLRSIAVESAFEGFFTALAARAQKHPEVADPGF